MVFVKYISYHNGSTYPGMSYSDSSLVRVEKIDKDTDELINTKHDWVCKAADKRIAPTGVKLEPCPWHSNFNTEKCDLNNPPTFGIWLSDSTVIDTCHIQEKIDRDDERKEINKMENLCRDVSWFHDAKSLHEGFSVHFEKRNSLLTQINSMKKDIEKIKAGPDTKNQEYVILLSRANKAEEMYNQRVESLTKSHKSSIGKVDPLEDFISKRTVEEKTALDKAKDDVQRWYNSHLNKDVIAIFEKVNLSQKLADILTANLKRNFNSSYTYVFRAVENLRKIKNYYLRYKLTRDYSLENVKMDILLMEAKLGEYHEFVNGVSPYKIIEEFEKEQECAIREEKSIKSGKSVQRINNSQTTNVVLINGTLEKNITAEQIIIGATVTGKNSGEKSEASNWRDLAGTTLPVTSVNNLTPVITTTDDSKWSKLR